MLRPPLYFASSARSLPHGMVGRLRPAAGDVADGGNIDLYRRRQRGVGHADVQQRDDDESEHDFAE